jgi:hypothetical protein
MWISKTSIEFDLRKIELTTLPVSLISFTPMKLFVITDGHRMRLF